MGLVDQSTVYIGGSYPFSAVNEAADEFFHEGCAKVFCLIHTNPMFSRPALDISHAATIPESAYLTTTAATAVTRCIFAINPFRQRLHTSLGIPGWTYQAALLLNK